MEGLCKQIQDNEKPHPNKLQFKAPSKSAAGKEYAPECEKPAELDEPDPVAADAGPEPEGEESWWKSWDSDEDENIEESLKRKTKSRIKIIIG